MTAPRSGVHQLPGTFLEQVPVSGSREEEKDPRSPAMEAESERGCGGEVEDPVKEPKDLFLRLPSSGEVVVEAEALSAGKEGDEIRREGIFEGGVLLDSHGGRSKAIVRIEKDQIATCCCMLGFREPGISLGWRGKEPVMAAGEGWEKISGEDLGNRTPSVPDHVP